MRIIVCAIVIGLLQSPLLPAQTLDTLPFRVTPMEHVPDSATKPMPASHRSAEENVDQPVRVIYCPEPSYPTALGEYGFGGQVNLVFVIDTSGFAELQDLVVSEASHNGFIGAARRAIAKCRYRPAQKAGRPVHFLVQQRVVFRVQEHEPSH
jgi:outer membrane biosynthesis protein TonB